MHFYLLLWTLLGIPVLALATWLGPPVWHYLVDNIEFKSGDIRLIITPSTEWNELKASYDNQPHTECFEDFLKDPDHHGRCGINLLLKILKSNPNLANQILDKINLQSVLNYAIAHQDMPLLKLLAPSYSLRTISTLDIPDWAKQAMKGEIAAVIRLDATRDAKKELCGPDAPSLKRH